MIPSATEEARIKDRHGAVVDFDRKTLTCTLLVAGKCSIYADRPLLCRFWGVVEKMPCVFGCDNPEMPAKDERRAMELVYGSHS